MSLARSIQTTFAVALMAMPGYPGMGPGLVEAAGELDAPACRPPWTCAHHDG
jgi:hypothetical protein